MGLDPSKGVRMKLRLQKCLQPYENGRAVQLFSVLCHVVCSSAMLSWVSKHGGRRRRMDGQTYNLLSSFPSTSGKYVPTQGLGLFSSVLHLCYYLWKINCHCLVKPLGSVDWRFYHLLIGYAF